MSMTAAALATALDTDARTARKFLRSITPAEDRPGRGAQWVVTSDKRTLNSLKKRFDKWTADAEAAKATNADA